MGTLCCWWTRPADGNRWQTAPMLSHLEAWNLVGLFFDRCLLYLLHMHILCKALANGAYVIWLGGLELTCIDPWPVSSVPVAHVQLMVTAGNWLWCCTCSSDGNRWYTILMLTSREAWKQFHSSLFCRCLPVPAAHARLMVGRGMRLSGVCRSMDGAWPAPGSGAHPDLLTASMKSNLEPLWKRKETTN